jgi:hypothetical protein
MISASILAVSLLITAEAPASAAAAAPADAPKSKLVCKVQEEIGSRLARKKVCMTQEEWQDLRRETRQVTEKIQTQRATNY